MSRCEVVFKSFKGYDKRLKRVKPVNLAAVTMKNTALWDMMNCSLEDRYRRFE
jgi:hypothetical protein